jgi:hypothetical protein
VLLISSVSAGIIEGDVTPIETVIPDITEITIEPTIIPEQTIEPIEDVAIGIIEFPTIESGKLIIKYHNLKSVSDIVITDADTGEFLDVSILEDIITIDRKLPLRIVSGNITWIIRCAE